MSAALLVVAMLGVWNVFRLHPALPAGDRSRAERISVTGLGVAMAIAALAVVGEFADDLYDWLDITPATGRIAVGVVLILVAVFDFLGEPPAAEPASPGVRAALVPVLFPLLFSPGAALLALVGASDRGLGAFVGIAALAGIAIVIAAAAAPSSDLSPAGRRVERGLHRLLSAALLLAAVGIVIDGLFDI